MLEMTDSLGLERVKPAGNKYKSNFKFLIVSKTT